jgi:phage tail P2-like protein
MSEKSLLPFNATALEKTVEQSICRAATIPVSINTLWDAYTCPSALLPWLAWAMSVDDWDSTWTEDIKRDLIANSVQIHREKGTLAAIERVLSVLGIVADIDEWFNNDGPPHTFNVTAWVNSNVNEDDNEANGSVLSQSLYDALRKSLNNVKPVRSHYDFRVGVAFDSQMALANASTALSVVSVVAEPTLAVDFTPIELSLGPVFTQTNYIRITLEAQ